MVSSDSKIIYFSQVKIEKWKILTTIFVFFVSFLAFFGEASRMIRIFEQGLTKYLDDGTGWSFHINIKKVRRMRKNIISPFIELIWDIIEDPETDGIISWSPNGTSFLILDQEAFSNDILSKHFKHANISSFIRQVLRVQLQLNMYNFHKNKHNCKQLQFFHKLFRRGAKELLIGIKRKPSQADQKQGEELLRQFLFKKNPGMSASKSCKDSDHSQQEKGCENTAMQTFLKKPSLLGSDTDNTDYNIAGVQFAPRLVLNIILINKPEDLVI